MRDRGGVGDTRYGFNETKEKEKEEKEEEANIKSANYCGIVCFFQSWYSELGMSSYLSRPRYKSGRKQDDVPALSFALFADTCSVLVTLLTLLCDN